MMFRDHSIYKVTFEYDAEEYHPDPEAPGGGEMTRTGRVVKCTRSKAIIAPSQVLLIAYVKSTFKNARVIEVEQIPIDAVLELHT